MKRNASKKQRSHKRRMSRGGTGVASLPYTSATGYEKWMLGSENDQYARVFDQGGPNNSQSNAIMANQNSGTLGYLPYQRAGKRRGSRKLSRRHKKGGFLGNVVNQAIVPFGLVGLNQYYGKRRGSKTRKTRKMRKY
jgi:hypothetical protein